MLRSAQSHCTDSRPYFSSAAQMAGCSDDLRELGSGSFVLLVSLQLFKQIIRGPCGAASDLQLATLNDLANLVHRHDLSAENDRDLPAKTVARQTLQCCRCFRLEF